MKKSPAIIIVICFVLASCKLSQTQLKERARPAIIQYFQTRHPGVVINSLTIVKVEKINEGRAAYKAYYEIKTTDTTSKDLHITIRILPKANDFVLLTKDFNGIVN